MSKYSCTVVIAFYNKIEVLKLLLAGYESQSVKDFEIIIADDGSKEEVVKELTELIQVSPLDIQHLWHEDDGWRKNVMLNKCLLSANSDYIIFTDGDCIPHRHFVQSHLEYRSPKVCLAGRRANLSQKISQELTSEKIKDGYLSKKLCSMIFQSFLGHGNHIEKGIYIRSKALRRQLNKKEVGILGCNFSIYKQDLIDINGFDERYLDPGFGEDSDINVRLKNNGITVKGLRYIAIQYHFYHKQLPGSDTNRRLYEETVQNKAIFTPYGIVKL